MSDECYDLTENLNEKVFFNKKIYSQVKNENDKKDTEIIESEKEDTEEGGKRKRNRRKIRSMKVITMRNKK